MPFISHEAIEDGQVAEEAEEAEVEEEEEYDTESDSDYPTAPSNDKEDSLDDLMFLRAVTTRNRRMVRDIYRK